MSTRAPNAVDHIAAVANAPAAPVLLSANCKRMLAAKARLLSVQISGCALELAHQQQPTVRGRQEMGACAAAMQQAGAEMSRAAGMLTDKEHKALAAYLNPTDDAAEAKAVGGLLVPAGAVVH